MPFGVGALELLKNVLRLPQLQVLRFTQLSTSRSSVRVRRGDVGPSNCNFHISQVSNSIPPVSPIALRDSLRSAYNRNCCVARHCVVLVSLYILRGQ